VVPVIGAVDPSPQRARATPPRTPDAGGEPTATIDHGDVLA
jgi:hypothetical protein